MSERAAVRRYVTWIVIMVAAWLAWFTAVVLRAPSLFFDLPAALIGTFAAWRFAHWDRVLRPQPMLRRTGIPPEEWVKGP